MQGAAAAAAAVAQSDSNNIALSENEINSYLIQAEELATDAWQQLHSNEWQQVIDKQQVRVLNRKSPYRASGYGWRLETEVELPAARLFVEMWDRIDHHADWNPNIVFSRVVLRINDSTSLMHNATGETAGGIVKARDFATLRIRSQQAGTLLTAGVSVVTDAVPPLAEFVRGHNYPGCIACVPTINNSCRIVWTMDSDIKGWIPKAIVNQAMSSVVFQLGLSIRELAQSIIDCDQHDSNCS